jgi:hypothetical protein
VWAGSAGSGATGRAGGTPAPWQSWFNNDNNACITLEVNQPGPNDNYLALGGTATLTVAVQSGSSSTNYTVGLWSAGGNGTPAGNVTLSTSSVTVAGGGGAQTITISGATTGYVTISGTASNAATGTVSAAVVQLLSLTASNGATQTNVTGGTNWAAIKSGSGNVVVQATLTPNVNPWGPANLVTWTGGNPVPRDMLQRTVPLATSAETNVTALCGSTSGSVGVWVLWATIFNMTSGTTPGNAVMFQSTATPGNPVYDGTEYLGARSFAEGNVAVGKVIPVATITPLGVNAVVQAGWNFNRRWFARHFRDGLADNAFWDSAWRENDSSHRECQNLTPDKTDMIYDRDAPNIAVFGAVDSYERNDNYQEWVTWNGTSGGSGPLAESSGTVGMCSDYAGWCWQARAKKSARAYITYMVLSAGSLSIPGTNGSYYKQTSGTITLSGGTTGLAGVTVTAPCTSSDTANTIGNSGTVWAKTAADGTYTIYTVPAGTVLTPTLSGGYTFTPGTLTVAFSNAQTVTGQNFTATRSP